GVVTVTATTAGASGNSIALAEGVDNFVWNGNHISLQGGVDGQPSIVGFTNLYVNSGGTGFCSGTAPTVKFAYRTTTATTGITGSPVLSLDGTKVAYVEDSSPPKLHVLTIGTTGSNGTIAVPVIPGT